MRRDSKIEFILDLSSPLCYLVVYLYVDFVIDFLFGRKSKGGGL